VSNEEEIEPVLGLPRSLPPGEDLVWQGRPCWTELARTTFHLVWLSVYFAVFVLARGVVAFEGHNDLAAALLASALVLPLAALCLGLLALLAWLNARSTVYTITTRRVVMRFGIAFPTTFNFPFRRIASADVRLGRGTDGDIALELSGPRRIAWLHLWPHVRPWHLRRAQPMLKSIPHVEQVATLMAEAVRKWSLGEEAPVQVAAQSTAVRPSAAMRNRRPSLARVPRSSRWSAEDV
jgi:hypothetical protein